MNEKYTYLLINFLTVLFPVLLSFDKNVHFYKKWKYIFPAQVISGLCFLLWDYIFTLYDVWSFNSRYVTGLYFLNLPIEEILFFVTVPFSCIFIYECLNFYVKKDILARASLSITHALTALSVVLLVFYHDRVYTLITFGLLLANCLYVYLRRPDNMGRFYLAFLVSMFPFYIVNGILTSLPIVMYNDAQNMGLRISTVPFEDHFYSLSMLLINILLFEYFRRKGKNA
ncbi:lycopene cyclase domain-containing protein [Arcticibacter sp.]|uniref:lycopene cyclase domain-containing protein n=1 Tax=Arcticibacter sp. TaxID=1872630 RepID=UPI0038905EC6